VVLYVYPVYTLEMRTRKACTTVTKIQDGYNDATVTSALTDAWPATTALEQSCHRAVQRTVRKSRI